MLNNSNNGMYLETIVNNSALYYKNNQTLAIFKRTIPIKIVHNNGQTIVGKIVDKSESDYYGIYHGLFFDFEAKQTNKDKFFLCNLKDHQWNHLLMVHKMQGISFLLLYFSSRDDFFAINTTLLKDKHDSITYEWCKQNAFRLELFFPGVLNFEAYLTSLKDN